MIREATLADVDQIVDLSAKLYAEVNNNFDTFSPRQCRGQIISLIKRADSVVLVDSDLTYFLCGRVSRPLFSSERWVEEIAWWGQGSTKTATAIVRAFLKWAKEQEPDQIVLHDMTPQQKASRIYRRVGMHKFQTSYKWSE